VHVVVGACKNFKRFLMSGVVNAFLEVVFFKTSEKTKKQALHICKIYRKSFMCIRKVLTCKAEESSG